MYNTSVNTVRMEIPLATGARLQIVTGNLILESSDAVVNAANSQLQHGGGVAGALRRAAGPSLQQESDEWVRQHGTVTHVAPAITSGGNLPCRSVIHAVGPVWGEGEEDEKLTTAVKACLDLASSRGMHSISLPAISTGIFGFPLIRGVTVILDAIRQHFLSPSSLKLVRLVLRDEATFNSLEYRE